MTPGRAPAGRRGKTVNISLPDRDHDRLTRLRAALEATSNSETVRAALRALEREIEAQRRKQGKGK
jgi:Arc/MetJ-type ribon-helix-helix transcriptional regulator